MPRAGSKLDKTKIKEENFAREYIKRDRNATLAAIAVGCAPKSAAVEGSKLLNSPKVQEYLSKHVQRIEKRFEITIDKVIQEMAKVGFSNLADFMTIDSEGMPFIDMSKITPEQFAALGEVTVTTVTTEEGEERKSVKIKLHSKMDALTKLLTHLGGFDGKGKPNGDTTNFNLTQLNVRVEGKKLSRSQIERAYFEGLKDVTRLTNGES